MKWTLILLLLAAGGQSALAQESRGAGGYLPPVLLPPAPGVDAEEAFRAGDRRRIRKPDCSKPDAPKDCSKMLKYAEEYNRTLELLERKLGR